MISNTDLIKAKTKFTELIKILTKKEWNKLGDYINSPFVNKQKKQIELYQFITKRFPLKKALLKTDILPILYPEKSFNQNSTISKQEDIQLRKLLFGFTSLIENFLIMLQQENDKIHTNRLLIDSLMTRKCYHLVEPIIRKSEQLLNAAKKETTSHFYQRYRIEESNLYMKVIQSNRSNEIPFKQVIEHFTNYYLTNLLLYYNAAVNVERILNVKNEYPLMDTFIAYLDDNWQKHIPLTQAYYHLHKSLKNEKGAHDNFEKLEEIMYSSIDKFDTTTNRQIFNFMLNFCSRQIKQLNLEYQEKKHRNYAVTIPLKIWNDGLYFSPHVFMNAIINACMTKRFEWAKETTELLQNEFNPKYVPDITLIAHAYIFFHQKNYNEARLKLLEFQGKEDFFYVLASKLLWIQIYYDDPYYGIDDYRHPLINQLESLRSYLKRNTNMSDRIKNSYSNFMRFTSRLFRIRASQGEGKDTTKLVIRLKQDIEICEHLVEMTWLLDKANELLPEGQLASE